MALRWDRRAVKQAILAALGLAACGPNVGGSGSSGEGEGGSSSSTATSESTGEPPWTCGATVPTDVSPPVCSMPQPILQASVNGDVPTGLELCDDGRLHRVAAVACEYPPALAGDCDPTLEGGTCETDADCTDGAHGFCMAGSFEAPGCSCRYGCEVDADCGEGELCLCQGVQSHCVAAHCSVDADCQGWACALGSDARVCEAAAVYFACQTPADTCSPGGLDCQNAVCEGCAWSPDDCTWACRYDEDLCSDCGRPFLVDGQARTAAAVARDDWSTPGARAAASTLDDMARAHVAAHWQRCALAEHASVAAFARYVLDLLALAAPAELIAEASAAMSDEIEHARLCFALVAHYGGGARGPGPLPSDDALGERDALRILDDVVREACIGETLAALEAIEALAEAREPAVRAALERIADDELRHAQLGWRHLRWALEHATADMRAAIIELLDDALADAMMAPVVGAADASLRHHGVLDAESRVRARTGGLLDVVRPCAAALLAATATTDAIAVA